MINRRCVFQDRTDVYTHNKFIQYLYLVDWLVSVELLRASTDDWMWLAYVTVRYLFRK